MRQPSTRSSVNSRSTSPAVPLLADYEWMDLQTTLQGLATATAGLQSELQEMRQWLTAASSPSSTSSPGEVNEVASSGQPDEHYRHLTSEPIHYIEANDFHWAEANIIKYVSRWRHKNGTSDLKKALWYIERLIEQNGG